MKECLFFIALSFLAIFITGCYESRMDFPSKGDVLSDQLIAKTGKHLEKKYNMSISGVGGSEKNGIWLMTIIFSRYGDPLDIPQARRIIIDCIQEFLSDINNDDELRPYLKMYPFTAANLDIDIINYNPDGGFVFDPDIEVVSGYRGKMIYCTRDPGDHFKYKSNFYETYDEALSILAQERGL